MPFVNKVMGPHLSSSVWCHKQPCLTSTSSTKSTIVFNILLLIRAPHYNLFFSTINFHGSFFAFSLGPDKFIPSEWLGTTCTPIQLCPSSITPRVDYKEHCHTLWGFNDKLIENKHKVGKKKPFSRCGHFISAFAKSAHFDPDGIKLCCNAIITASDYKFVDVSFISGGKTMSLKVCSKSQNYIAVLIDWNVDLVQE